MNEREGDLSGTAALRSYGTDPGSIYPLQRAAKTRRGARNDSERIYESLTFALMVAKQSGSLDSQIAFKSAVRAFLTLFLSPEDAGDQAPFDDLVAVVLLCRSDQRSSMLPSAAFSPVASAALATMSAGKV